MQRAIAYLGLGSNLGDRTANLRSAVALLRENGCDVVRASSLYETKPLGVEDQPEFLNAVVKLETELEPRQLLDLCLDVERKVGRKRTFRWGPRVIDVDVLLYDTATVNADDLVIPHPRMAERAFVVVPLAEVAPDVDVGGGVSAARAAENVGDAGVRKIADSDWAD